MFGRSTSEKLLNYADITSSEDFYRQLMSVEVRDDFKPHSKEDCVIVRTGVSEEGYLSHGAVEKISEITKRHEKDSSVALWLLVFTHHPSSITDLATVICLPGFRESRAVGHNTRGMRFPDAVISFIEKECSGIKGVVNVNTIAARPTVRTLFEGGLSGFSGAASSCMTKNLGEALPLMSSAWGKHLQSLQLEHSAGLGLGAGSSGQHEDDDETN